MIEILIGFIYQWIVASWLISSILVKYFLLGILGYEIVVQKNSAEKIKEDFIKHSYYFVSLLVGIGLIISLTGLNPKPGFPVIGEITALGFYAYLFWEY
ncbi:MAG: hypothetical protein ACI977_000520 [Candidatus Nanohaloarchaea archaeon]|jgi:hypothetical protein